MTSTATNNSLPEVGAVKSDILSQSAGGVIGSNTGRNVSVTPINMTDTQFNSGQFSYSSNGIRINVPSEEQRRVAGSVNIDDEDSNDAEVSKIDFSQTNHYQVNMRTKKKRPSSSTLALSADGQTVQDNNAVSNDRDRERPMSWEGELSDSEMLVDSNTANTPDALLSNSKTPYSDLEFRLGNQKEGNGFCVKTEPIEREGAFVPANRHSSVSFQSLNDHDALNLKFGSSHHPTLQQHQRSHSMNRVSILSNDNNLDIKNSTLIPPKSHADLIGGSESGNEQIIKNIPVNIIPTTLSNKMASEAQAYAAKREQLMHQTTIPEIKPELPLLVDKLLGGYSIHSTPSNSPLLNRHHKIVSNPSTDSAIHSVYTHSVYSSPSASPGATRHAQYTPSLSRNNSDASHSSCYSYSSEFSPTHSPVQGRHPIPAHAAMLFRSEHGAFARQTSGVSSTGTLEGCTEGGTGSPDPEGSEDRIHHHQGVSRQQLINSPCPICGDKISGFHYGIFSCESCKGFFKRTVQNRKNYVCLRGANCPVTVATRKKCPACRFDKCLHCGMKLEAIREDRTRGGRSTYQCSYTLSGAASTSSLLGAGLQSGPLRHATSLNSVNGPSSHMSYHSHHDLHSASLSNSVQGPLNRLTQSGVKSEPGGHNSQVENIGVPALLQEIMDVEHLWQYNESELTRLNRGQPPAGGSSATTASPTANPFLRAAGVPADTPPDFLANLCNIADHRLYKIVKWCKSLPLFKNISIDDQICLLINSWCELLVLSCCYRGVSTPGEVRVGGGNGGITLQQSTKMGLSPCIERMLHFTDHLRRLRVDRYEYVAMKVIVLLNSDTSELKEPEKVRSSQGKALQALQDYTLAHYRDAPAKFGELLLRIPELQKTCQVGKEMLNPSNKNKDGETSSFNLLMELLRGDH